MMYQEFKDLTQTDISYEVYSTVIEPMYMATNLNKEEFIKAINLDAFTETKTPVTEETVEPEEQVEEIQEPEQPKVKTNPKLFVTQATEKRIKKMVKNHCRYGLALENLLYKLKAWEGYEDYSIKEMRDLGIQIDNQYRELSIDLYTKILTGMSCNYQGLISVALTYDLSHCYIPDFNKLVKTISDDFESGRR